MINNTAVENKHPTKGDIKAVYPITFSGATDSGGLPMFKVTLTYADGSSKELAYNIDYALVYDDVQENNNESFNKPHLNGIKFLLPEYAVDGNTLYILRTTPFVQPVDFQIGRIDPEQIEKVTDLSVLRDQEIRNQADKDRATIQECQRDINDNAEAIQKVRDDFSAEDAKIHERIDAHAEELDTIHEVQATANANIESNAKAIQKTRDDFTAADSVLRKDIDVNESEIVKLRDDMNASDTVLQDQITAQAAEIATKQDQLTAGDNIIISGNIISATGAGGGVGFDVIVVQELPESGEKGIIYLVPKDGAAPDVFDEYVWVATTSTFELIGSTKVDLTDYVKKTDYAAYGKAGVISVNAAYGTQMLNEKGLIGCSIRPLTSYKNDSNYAVIGKGTLENIKDDYVKRGIAENTIVLTDAEKTAAQNWLGISSGLPDQTDNAGKFLTTDGTEASWSDKPLVNNSTRGLGIIGNTKDKPSVAIGTYAYTNQSGCVAISNNYGSAAATNIQAVCLGGDTKASGMYSTALGSYAKAQADYATQLGKGTNSDANTFKVGNNNGNFEMMSADGTIPAERIGNLDFGTMD